MPKDSETDIPATAIAEAWLTDFNAALADNDMDALRALFMNDAHWRDVLAFDWRLSTISGSGAIADKLKQTQPAAQAAHFQVGDERTPPRMVMRAGADAILTYFAVRAARLLRESARGAGKP